MKKITALLLALAMLFAFAACGSDSKAEETTAADVAETGELAADVSETAADGETVAAPAETNAEGETVAAPAETNAEGETVAAPAETNAAGETVAAPAETKAGEATTAAKAAAPSSTSDVLAYYNKAVNGAYAAKVGFNKERYCDNEVMDMSLALKPFKGLVEQFVDIGADNKYTENVTKGKWESETNKHYLRQSTLTAGDINSATCKDNGGVYTITIKVKDGSSNATEGKKANNSPIDKCGICAGNEDKSYYDHKTALVIYDAIDDTYAGAKINEKYSGATITATVDSATGHLTGLKVEYKISVGIDISIGSGTATGMAHIIYKNFKY